MKDYLAKDIRNIAVLGHGSEGKTTLVESMLFATGAIDRQGRVEDGNTVSDWDPEEKKRTISISASVAPVEIHGKKINFIDVPGYFDFIGEASGALAAVEGALIVMSAATGMSTGFEKAWEAAGEAGVARFIAISQMDREHVSYEKVITMLREKYGSCIVPMVLPIGEGPTFKGVVDVLSGKAFTGSYKNLKEIPVPDDMKDAMAEAIHECTEAAAGTSEELMEKFFEEDALSPEEMIQGLSAGILDGSIVPVAPVSGVGGIGVSPLLYALATYMPSPEGHTYRGVRNGEEVEVNSESESGFTGFVFKTIADPFVGKMSLVRVISGKLTGATALYNASQDKAEKAGSILIMRGNKQTQAQQLVAGDIGALSKLQFTATGDSLGEAGKAVKFERIVFPAPQISMAVYAKKAGEEDKVFSGLSRLCEEMPDVVVAKDSMTMETLISGQGELELEVVRQKLLSKFGAEAVFKDPKIAYRETIRKTIDVQGRHKKQSGGHGQFGDVKIIFSPTADPAVEFEFEDAVVGGAVPRNYIPSVEKGLRENLVKGVLAGFPMTGLHAKLYDGSYHPVDSSEMAFKTAARIAYKQCINANPVLLEPIMHVEVTVPDEYMGDIIGDMNKRRGRILGMEPKNGKQVVTAEVPQAEMFKYATDLRSMTQAKGSFTMTFERYEEVPKMNADKIIEAHKADLEDDED